jgi:hypothetical protein
LAKTTVPAPVVPQNLLPKTTDPRSELFYLLGHLKGQNIESADRITELVIDLTTPAVEE